MGDTMEFERPQTNSLISFLYYENLAPIAEFYEEVMGFELVRDQGIAKIYRVNQAAYFGIVDGTKGHLKTQPQSAVLTTIVSDDVAGWHAYLADKGVAALTEIQHGNDCLSFFFEDPGGYALEVQSFHDPEIHKQFRL